MTAASPLECRFEELVRSNERRIYAIARSFARPGERQDLCQEILLQIWKGLGGFEGRSAPATWVYRVALNTAITYRRRNGRRSALSARSLEMTPLDPVAPSAPASEVAVLEDFLRSVGKIDRAVLLLYLEDLSYRDISEVTGLSENHVGVRINRLKRAFGRTYCGW